MSTVDPPKTNGNDSVGARAASKYGKNGKNGAGKAVRPAGADLLNHRELLAALRAFKRGNFDVRLREDLTGVDGQIVETFNELVSMVEAIKEESHEVCQAVG